MDEYLLRVHDGRIATTYQRKEDLKRAGYRYNPKRKTWEKNVEAKDLKTEKEIIKLLDLKVEVLQKENMRGGHYRRDFFETYSPDKKGRYRCAYCGRKLKKDNVTVDHIIPVYTAERNGRVRWLMKRFGISSVNDPKNLCASCKNCNSRKGKKTGSWILLGHLGRTRWFWPTIHILLLMIILIIVAVIIVS